MKPLCNQPSLVPIYSAIIVVFKLVHPLTTNQILRRRGWNQGLGNLPFKGCKLFIHCCTPLWILSNNSIRWWFSCNIIRLRSRTSFSGVGGSYCRISFAGLKWDHMSGGLYSSSLGNKGFRLKNLILRPGDHRLSIDRRRNLWGNRGNGSGNRRVEELGKGRSRLGCDWGVEIWVECDVWGEEVGMRVWLN